MAWTIKAVNRTHEDFLSEENKKWTEPFFFVQGADSQFGMFAVFKDIATVPEWQPEIDLAEEAVRKVNQMTPKPKFYVICGDLCHNSYVMTPTLRAAQDADFKKVFAKVDPSIPLVCVCGNHDVGDNPTTESIQKYKNNFGDDYFSFFAGGVFFICINSQFFHGATLVPEQIEAQERWIDSQLEIAKQSPLPSIMFQHVPWFLSDPENSEKNYYEIEPVTRKRMLDKLLDAGVKHVFCGHYHRNAGGRYKDLECIVTSAIGYQLGDDDKSGMRIVKVYQDKVEHQYYELSQLPDVVNI